MKSPRCKRKRTPFSMAAKRAREIAMLVLYRHRWLPDTDDRSIYLEMAAHHLKPRDGDLVFALDLWARRVGAKLSDRELSRVARNVSAKPRLFKADTLGNLLRVTYDERSKLKLTTIGCYDVSKAQRRRLRKQKRRLNDQARRRENGAIPRAQYLANSLTRQQPWLVAGISRRTWYRRRQTQMPPGLAQMAQVRGQHSYISRVRGPVPSPAAPIPRPDASALVAGSPRSHTPRLQSPLRHC